MDFPDLSVAEAPATLRCGAFPCDECLRAPLCDPDERRSVNASAALDRAALLGAACARIAERLPCSDTPLATIRVALQDDVDSAALPSTARDRCDDAALPAAGRLRRLKNVRGRSAACRKNQHA